MPAVQGSFSPFAKAYLTESSSSDLVLDTNLKSFPLSEMALLQSLFLDLEEIAHDGDVILVVGAPAELRLLVSSSVLRHASSVFKAMLDGAFREGQRRAHRSKDLPQTIRLPEDSADAVADMCSNCFQRRSAVIRY